jgi:hypothetical protein
LFLRRLRPIGGGAKIVSVAVISATDSVLLPGMTLALKNASSAPWSAGCTTCEVFAMPGVWIDPGGNRHRTRHLLNQEFMQALLLHFRKDGKKVIEKVARNQPAAYMKICALLIPKEMKIEHFSTVKDLTDEELESAIATLKAIMAAQASESAKLIDGSAEPAALPTPEAQSIAGPERKRQAGRTD